MFTLFHFLYELITSSGGIPSAQTVSDLINKDLKNEQ